MATLAICCRSNVPTLFQRLANFRLSEMCLLRPIVVRALGLAIFRNEIGRLHVIGLPIQICDLIFRAKEILRMTMAFQTPGHAHRFGVVNHRHVVDLPVATGAADAAIHVGRVIVKNVIRQAMNPHPIDRTPVLPTLAHRLELRIIFLDLAVTVHANLGVRHVGMGGHFDEAVAITAIHPQLSDVDVVRERHRLDRLVTDLGIFGRYVIPRGRGQARKQSRSRPPPFAAGASCTTVERNSP